MKLYIHIFYFRLLPTTNRTTLELKRKRIHDGTRIDLRYQSHHTGIETVDAIMLKNPDFTTNRTTLELKLHLKIEPVISVDYQSHHTGIETIEEDVLFCKAHATNRTTLELKPNSTYTQLGGFVLPIAPHWN